MASSLLALLDDITTLLDDVAVLSKVAVKKTSGVVGDDLALNAEQVTGLKPDRELPVVWAVAKGSFVNKLILVPAALLISAFAPRLIVPLLMIGGVFLCYEGFEKVWHKLAHREPAPDAKVAREVRVAALANPEVDLVALERTRIRGAIRTDFILSAEIVVIALGTMAAAPMLQQVVALSLIGVGITVLVYGLVAGIVKLDDLGMQLVRTEGAHAAAASARAFGAGILRMAPWLMRTLSVVGTAAMFLVGGSIVAHGIPALEHLVASAEHAAGAGGTFVKLLADALVGIAAGGIVVGVLALGKRVRAMFAVLLFATALGALPAAHLRAQTAARPAAAENAVADSLLLEVRALNRRRTQNDTAGLVTAHERMLARVDSLGAGSTLAAEETLRGLSILLYQRREYARAVRAQERLAPLVDTLSGPESRAAGQEWHNLGFLRGANGQHEGAVAAYERALAIRRQVLPERDPLALTTYRQLASSLRARAEARAAEGQLVGAWNDYARSLELTDFSDGPDSEPSRLAMMQLMLLLEPIAAGSTDVMLGIGVENIVRIAERTVAWLETELAPDDPRLAGIRAGLDVLRLGASATSLDARQTRDAARRSLASAEATSGPDSREAALALLGLGRAETSLREFDAARASLARALAIRERQHGAESEPAAEVRRAIGELLQEEGRLPEARAEFERAIAIVERAGGDDSPLLVPYLKALAGLLNSLGDRQQAGRLESRVASIEARASADVASPEGALRALLDASDLEIAGRHAEARRLRERSLPTLIRGFGEGHIVVAAARLGLARNLIKSQDFAAAAVLVEQAIAAAGRTFGERSSEYAVATMMQVELEKAQQDYAAAETTLKRIVAINAEALGAAHPQGFAARFDLADVLMTQRKGPEGVQVVLDATRDVDRYAREVLPTLAVAEQQAFLEQTLPTAMTFALMSIHIQRQSLPELYDRIGGWKGLLLRGIDRQAAIARLASNRDASADLRRLTTVRNELASLTQAAPSMDAAQLRRERERLTTEKEALERRLAALVPETPDRWMGIDSLRARMPARTALVDVFRHGFGDQARYAAVVVLADERVPRYADLGPAQRIENFVNEWRREVTNDQFAIDQFWRVSASTIDEIAKVMPDSLRFVWISPDGNLSRLPWATMSAYNERVGRANAAQVPSARALMPLLERPAPSERHGVVLVGGVDFDAGTRARERPGTRWQALPGTATEIQSIARLADSLEVPVRSVTGAAATPSAVSTAFDDARIVHLATHGFFFGESENVVNSRGVVGVSPTRVAPAVSSRNPLAESGLALAGANVNPAGNLTAEQILALDLRGLDLVVLSACETGRGTEVTGQGVLGLQASLLSAGTRGMVMSLWKVPDESTAFLMERFYFYYLDGYSAPTALRDAQRDVLQDERFKNPIHWAGWVFVGTLDG